MFGNTFVDILTFEPSSEREKEEWNYRNAARGSILMNYATNKPPVRPTDKRKAVTPLQSFIETTLLVDAKSFSTWFPSRVQQQSKKITVIIVLTFLELSVTDEAELLEPFWISFAFYDAEKKTKLSDELYVEWNDTKLLSALTKASPIVDDDSNAKRGLYRFSYVSDAIYVVVKVYHIMKGYKTF